MLSILFFICSIYVVGSSRIGSVSLLTFSPNTKVQAPFSFLPFVVTLLFNTTTGLTPFALSLPPLNLPLAETYLNVVDFAWSTSLSPVGVAM